MYNFEYIRTVLRTLGLEIEEFRTMLEHGVEPEIEMRCRCNFAPFQPEHKRIERNASPYSPLRIVKNGVATIVFWQDGTKTVVKRGSDEPESDYAAFTAALGIKCFGSNSALKRIVSRTETQKPRSRKE